MCSLALFFAPHSLSSSVFGGGCVTELSHCLEGEMFHCHTNLTLDDAYTLGYYFPNVSCVNSDAIRAARIILMQGKHRRGFSMTKTVQIGFGSWINTAEFPVRVNHEQIRMYDTACVCVCVFKMKNRAMCTRVRRWAVSCRSATGVTAPCHRRAATSPHCSLKSLVCPIRSHSELMTQRCSPPRDQHAGAYAAGATRLIQYTS